VGDLLGKALALLQIGIF